MGLPCVTGRTGPAMGGGTWGRVPRAPGTKLLEQLLAILCPRSQTALNAAATFSHSVHRTCPPGSSPRPGCPEILLGCPQTGLAATWPTLVSSCSGGHGPKAPTVNQSLGCPVWSRLLQVNKDPQQTGCSESFRIASGS